MDLLIYLLIFSSFLSAYNIGPLPFSKQPNVDMFSKPLENNRVIAKFISSIPKKYSVAATNNLGSHLSRRQRIYTIPIGIDNADYILFLLNDRFAQPSLRDQIKMEQNLVKDSRYKLVFKLGVFSAFKKVNQT